MVWRPTGLYAAAGEIVTVTLPESLIGKAQVSRVHYPWQCNLFNISQVLIGAHTDTLWGKEELSRAPEITMRYKVTKATLEVANPYGGLIYITVSRFRS